MQNIINYDDKTALYENPSIPDINKVNASDMNEIKTIVNGSLQGTNAMGSIVVDDINCKNICDIATVRIGKQWNGGNDANTATVFIPVLPSTQYTISYENNPFADNYLIEKNGADDTTAVVSAVAITSPTTRTTNANTHYLAISFYKSSGAITQSDFDNFKIQVELGDTNTNIVPYKKIIKEENGYVKENTTFYANDFKCKNMFGVNSTAIRSGVTSIYNGSTLTLNGTSTGEDFNEDYTLKMVRLPAGTYTFTIQAISGTKTGSQSLVIRNIDNNSSILDTNFTGNYAYTFTLNQDTNINVLIYYLASGNVFTNYVMNIQLEKGSEATPYTPYKNFENEEIYSGNEIRIGTWIDGKPLYRRVITATPNIAQATTSSSFDINIANVDEVFIKDMTKIADTSSSGYVYSFPFVTGTLFIGGYIGITSTKLVFNVRKTNNIGLYAMRIVLDYTKTTD